MSRGFTGICWVMAIGFSICVGLQVNDPDPVRWMTIYGATAIVTAALPSRRIVALAGAAVGAGAAVWGAMLAHEIWGVIDLPDLWGKMSEKGGAVEVGREAGGLLIAATWLLLASGVRALRP